MLLAYSSPQHLPAQKVQQKGLHGPSTKCPVPRTSINGMFQGTASFSSAGGSRMYVSSGMSSGPAIDALIGWDAGEDASTLNFECFTNSKLGQSGNQLYKCFDARRNTILPSQS